MTRIASRVDAGSAEFRENAAHMAALVAELKRRQALAAAGGGEAARAKHVARGKLLPRERIEALLDPGSPFLEIAAARRRRHVRRRRAGRRPRRRASAASTAANSLVVANDATVKGGTYYPITVKKHLRAQEIALENRLPCVYLVDSGGAFLPLQDEVFPDREHFGRIFYNQARLSAAGIPQVAVVMGSCTAGGAYVPAMCDESIIVRNQGTIFLGGPPLVKAATGEVVDAESLGGGDVHARTSGVVDHLADNDAHALAMAREIVGSLNHRAPAWLGRREAALPAQDAAELYGIVPRDLRQPYDVREVIARLVDGSEFHEFKALYGKTLVCGFAHLWGYPGRDPRQQRHPLLRVRAEGRALRAAREPPQGAAPVPAEHHRLHGRAALRGRRHRARRREDGHGRRLLDRAEADGRDRRLLRCRQLRDVRARLRRAGSCGPGRTRAFP